MRINSGPIIPQRLSVENIIKNSPLFKFGIGPHLNKNFNILDHEDEFDNNLLKCKEVDEWLKQP